MTTDEKARPRLSRARLDAEAAWSDLRKPASRMRAHFDPSRRQFIIRGPTDEHIRSIPLDYETTIEIRDSGETIVAHPKHPTLRMWNDGTVEEIKP